MRRAVTLARRCVLLVSVLVIAVLPSAAADWGLNLVIGPRYLGDEVWEPIDGDAGWGLDVSVGKEKWPVRIAVGFFGSGDDNDEECYQTWGDEVCPKDLKGSVLERDISELSLGVLKKWGMAGRYEAYLGGGFTSMTVEVENKIHVGPSLGRGVEDPLPRRDRCPLRGGHGVRDLQDAGRRGLLPGRPDPGHGLLAWTIHTLRPAYPHGNG
jgi:hypothetical protein